MARVVLLVGSVDDGWTFTLSGCWSTSQVQDAGSLGFAFEFIDNNCDNDHNLNCELSLMKI